MDQVVQFLVDTISQPALFWPALEALTTVLAAIVIISELRRSRREAVAHRIDGFKYAMEVLGAEGFRCAVEDFRQTLDGGNPALWHTSLPPVVSRILRSLEIVALLIEQEYLDQGFFFRIESLNLQDLAMRIRVLEEGLDTPRFEEETRLYPRGRELLRRAQEWSPADP